MFCNLVRTWIYRPCIPKNFLLRLYAKGKHLSRFYKCPSLWRIRMLLWYYAVTGSGGLDSIFSPRRLSRQNSFGSIGTPRTPTMLAIADVVGSKNTLEATISSLQTEIADSKARCAALVTQSGRAEDKNLAEDVRQLNEKLESMQSLVTRLRTLINWLSCTWFFSLGVQYRIILSNTWKWLMLHFLWWLIQLFICVHFTSMFWRVCKYRGWNNRWIGSGRKICRKLWG